MTESEATTQLSQEMMELSSLFDDHDYSNAIDAAERETGWSFPQSNATKLYWLIERSKRYLFFYLMSGAAKKFKFKQYNLQHRFDHYKAIIKMMDESWAEAQEDLILAEGVGAFGTKVDAGFAYDDMGRDITYDEDQEVEFFPKDADY